MLQLSFVNFKKGSFIFVEGRAEANRFYIIQTGNVRCTKINEVPGTSPTILGPGDFIGVVPCMSDHFQIESATAITDVTAITVRKEQYPELISKNTSVAMKIIRTFAAKMRTMNEMLTKLTLKDVIQESPENIYNVALFYEKNDQKDIACYAFYQYLKLCKNGEHYAKATEHFKKLKPRSRAVYFEPTADLARTYPRHTMIFSEFQGGNDMFIIQSGQVQVSKVVNGNEVVLAMLNKGDMFGEMALIENKPRSASAIAHDECQVMVVNRQNFDQMVATQPQLIARLTTTLSERIWSMNRQIDNACLKDPVAKFADMLALQIEKARTNLSGGKVQMQTEITLNDLANMCGIPKDKQPEAIVKFQDNPGIKLVKGRIFIPDCMEIIKQAEFHRKQQSKNAKPRR